MAGSTSTSGVYIQVIEHVINKVHEEFINNGGPGKGVLSELQGLWELKMMQAGAIVGPVDRFAGVNSMVHGAFYDFFLLFGKRKRDEFPPQYRPGGFIPQQDGAAYVIADKFEVCQSSNPQPGNGLALSSKIPQLDGPIPDPYDEITFYTKCKHLSLVSTNNHAGQMVQMC
ncbi:uncharacterized protein [Rutidosis leptorrhynchoides]|uniref:uncharacterized protein n=1 Tax=Rutidosis leptorrhynchoides TaxID=125765 RepID=UPI003A99AD09